MNYEFNYKSKFERRSLEQKVNRFFSDCLFYLYGNWIFKKMRLDRNELLKYHVLRGKKRKIPNLKKSTIPENPNLNIYSLTLLDCVGYEDLGQLKNRLLKLASKYKGGFLSEEPSRRIKMSFEEFESAYKTTSWGILFYNNTSTNQELDLIDGISYDYIKGAQSHFIITYTIYPSDKFKLLFKNSLNAALTEESEIKFMSFRKMIKARRIFTSIGHNVKQPSYWTEKVFNEINFQFKTQVSKVLKIGIFNSKNDILFPQIVSFEVDTNEFSKYSEDLFRLLKIAPYEHFNNSDLTLTIKNSDFLKSSSNSLEIFFPQKSKEKKKEDQSEIVAILSRHYVLAIAPHWLLINISSLNRQNIITLRKKAFQYIQKNRISLFLKKAIRLKNKLSLDWITFERLRKDFSSDNFREELKFAGIPNALNTPRLQGKKPDEFKNNLVAYSKNISTDIKKSYEELLGLFKNVSEDNTIRANMKLQRLLFWIAIIGITLSIYSTNKEWFNSWIEYYLKNCNIEIPKPPNE